MENFEKRLSNIKKIALNILDESIVTQAMNLLSENFTSYEILARSYNSDFSKTKANPLDKLLLVLYLLPDIKKEYQKLEIDDGVFYSTFSDLKIWSNRHYSQFHTIGLSNLAWINNHINLKLFRLGRLQYQFFNFKMPLMNPRAYFKVPYLHGKSIFIHIPEGEKLNIDSCIESLKLANMFFKEYYPSFEPKGYICQSWLLCTNNKLYMSKNSNIIKFASLFNVVGDVIFAKSSKDRIFDFDYDENNPTTLQKQALAYTGKKNIFGEGLGFLKKEYLK